MGLFIDDIVIKFQAFQLKKINQNIVFYIIIIIIIKIFFNCIFRTKVSISN